MNHQRILLSTLAIAAIALFVTAAGLHAGEAKAFDAQAAFDRLTAMEGTWTGEGHSEGGEGGEGHGGVHEFEVSAAGTVVMETMFPGTDHEMINMYHLDGEDLVLTHYCAGGNQPTMKVDSSKAKAGDLPFMFTGGTNLDPATDEHIHNARLVFLEDGRLESHWMGYNDGEMAGEMVFMLSRSKGE